jgi:uncharacterized protein
MKIHPDHISVQSVTSYGPGWVQISTDKITRSTVITSSGERFNWDCERFEDLSSAHFEQLAALNTELVIFGSGARLRFAPNALTISLIERQIGMETMDTQAACRTYNILAAEGRHVAMALLFEPQEIRDKLCA